MRRSRQLTALIFAAALCAPAQIPEVSSTQATPVFRASTNLVQIPVVVRDNSGHAVGTLGAEDFQLFDNKKPQTISRFSVEKFETPESRATATKSHESKTQESAPSVASGESQMPDRFVALLVDDVNLGPLDFIRARNAALHYLDTLRPDERVSIYSASGKVSLDFTRDVDQLRKTLNSINSVDPGLHYSLPITAPNPPCRVTYFNQDLAVYHGVTVLGCPDGGTLGVGEEGDPTWAEVYHMMKTWGDFDEETYFSALSKLIAKMSEMPGQRSIFLVSPGIYVPARFQRSFRDVLSSAVRAKVIVSGIDARGVLGSGRYTASARSAPSVVRAEEVGDQQGGGEFMADITAGTGGIYIHGDNDLDGAFRRVDSVPGFVYLLAFSPTDLKLDGKRHELKIMLKNPRGFTVQARDGYYADSYSDDPQDEEKRQIEEAFFSSQESNSLPTQLRTKFFKDGDKATLTVTAKVDATRLPFRKEDGRNRDNLTLVVGLFDQNGNFISATQKDIQMALKDATLDAWMKSGIDTATDFDVTPGKYLVRLVVKDSEGSSISEQSTGVEIPW